MISINFINNNNNQSPFLSRKTTELNTDWSCRACQTSGGSLPNLQPDHILPHGDAARPVRSTGLFPARWMTQRSCLITGTPASLLKRQRQIGKLDGKMPGRSVPRLNRLSLFPQQVGTSTDCCWMLSILPRCWNPLVSAVVPFSPHPGSLPEPN